MVYSTSATRMVSFDSSEPAGGDRLTNRTSATAGGPDDAQPEAARSASRIAAVRVMLIGVPLPPKLPQLPQPHIRIAREVVLQPAEVAVAEDDDHAFGR